MSFWSGFRTHPDCAAKSGQPSLSNLMRIRVRDSVVSCLLLVTVYADTIVQVLGTLSPAMKLQLDRCLKTALALP